MNTVISEDRWSSIFKRAITLEDPRFYEQLERFMRRNISDGKRDISYEDVFHLLSASVQNHYNSGDDYYRGIIDFGITETILELPRDILSHYQFYLEKIEIPNDRRNNLIGTLRFIGEPSIIIDGAVLDNCFSRNSELRIFEQPELKSLTLIKTLPGTSTPQTDSMVVVQMNMWEARVPISVFNRCGIETPIDSIVSVVETEWGFGIRFIAKPKVPNVVVPVSICRLINIQPLSVVTLVVSATKQTIALINAPRNQIITHFDDSDRLEFVTLTANDNGTIVIPSLVLSEIGLYGVSWKKQNSNVILFFRTDRNLQNSTELEMVDADNITAVDGDGDGIPF